MKEFISNHTKLVVFLAIAVVLVFIARGYAVQKKQQEFLEEQQREQEMLEEAQQQEEAETSDSLIMMMQDDLIASYGELPEGYLWDIDGTLLSQGDKSKTAEEVVYAYMNGLQSLDMSIVQKYSRDSMVIETYSGYFDDTDRNTDYTDSFLRNMYRDCLLSLETEGIVTSSVFAENKQVFTVKVKMLDLTVKDFWLKDKDEIYQNLKVYSGDESDSTKAEMYLYEYILKHYESPEAATREVTFDLTLQKYPDLDTGWLVSIDTDIDNTCRYADGTLVVSYILEMFNYEGTDYLNKTGIYAEDYNPNTGEENSDYEEEDSEESDDDDWTSGIDDSLLGADNVKTLN